MIDWIDQEGVCEGTFKSNFFQNDENGDIFSVYAKSSDLLECAERCVEAFNNLTDSEINEICKRIINYVKENGTEEGFELPALENALDILNYCWFGELYVNMLSPKDEIFYVVAGEGEWGDVIGFVMNNNKVIYVGTGYFDYMKK